MQYTGNMRLHLLLYVCYKKDMHKNVGPVWYLIATMNVLTSITICGWLKYRVGDNEVERAASRVQPCMHTIKTL